MACSEFDSSLESAARLSFEDSCNMGIEESSLATPADLLAAPEVPTTSVSHNSNIPKPPPPPAVLSSGSKFSKRVPRFSNVPKEIKDMWNRLFEEGYKADVKILTDDVASTISAHSFVLVSSLCPFRAHMNFLTRKRLWVHCSFLQNHLNALNCPWLFFYYLEFRNYNHSCVIWLLVRLILNGHFNLPFQHICINYYDKLCHLSKWKWSETSLCIQFRRESGRGIHQGAEAVG